MGATMALYPVVGAPLWEWVLTSNGVTPSIYLLALGGSVAFCIAWLFACWFTRGMDKKR